MLGKAEYIKFVLKSVCEERIRIFLSDKIIADSANIAKVKITPNSAKESLPNPCLTFYKTQILLKNDDGELIESGDQLHSGDALVKIYDPNKPLEEQLYDAIYYIYDQAEGGGSEELASAAAGLTPAIKCWICRKQNIFGKGKEESLISFISGEGNDYDSFIEDLNCMDYGFQGSSGNLEGQGYIDGSFMDLIDKGIAFEEKKQEILEKDAFYSPQMLKIKEMDPIAFLNESGWYQEFINDLPEDYKNLYRFAAFVVNNIGLMGPDKFDITKMDGTALKHASKFINKGKLKNSEKVFGEWHLQKLFIDEITKMKGVL